MKCPACGTNTVFHAEKLDTFPEKTDLYAVKCSHCGKIFGAFDGSVIEHLNRIETKLDRLLEK
jgi:uncharacterized Zn finger protein